MTLADFISCHLSEFVESTKGNPPHEESRAAFLRMVEENRGTEPMAISPSAWRTIVPHWQAAIRTLDPLRYPQLPPPPRFEGWTVNVDRNKYIRLVRKRHGKMQSVYIGKIWRDDLARERLEAKGYY